MLLKLKYINPGEEFTLPSGDLGMKLELSPSLATLIAAGLYHKGVKGGEYAIVYMKNLHQLEIADVEQVMTVEGTPSVN